MKVKIPFYEEKTDVQLSFWGKAKSHLSEDEKRSLDILADYFTSCTIKFVGKNEHEYISIEKVDDGLIVECDDSVKVLEGY
ncbi:hypothetical protein [Blautia obeum]|uniref:Uncharacterized protein n=1 Tax=Blautia obeum TaxID=40520 RepID=A0A414SDZ5_9FIRM|nr:hypothetical protein [Blautia obeum]RHG17343.1 hypothetical protein DW272_09885 [Blautia obeum]SCH28960.1 Uncharacterised protein [uncultured Ruminococcus sp.]